ncbi:MAG TPA: methylated-DNA--[protein]-cysteine S-methyltransferase [Chroococcidiopsis sp.]
MIITSSATVSRSDDYDRIARAIAFMRQHHLEQPDLAAVAQHVNLSEFHLQRLFTRWAGISPKRFLQYLTVEYAKAQIAQTKSVLDLSLEVGLSSPGRLHDLFVTVEAMSPGEFKAGGAGLQIRYGLYDSPFGWALIATTARGLCHLHFLEDSQDTGQTGTAATDNYHTDPQTNPQRNSQTDLYPSAEAIAAQQLCPAWANADLIHDPQAIAPLGEQIFTPALGAPPQPLTLWVKGTNFQLQVWRALLQVPTGSITTYQAIAQLIDRPSATRAVGNAIGQNPVAYLIPCHRVIRESGLLGGYRWGLDRKAAMLGWEASQTQAAPTLDS